MKVLLIILSFFILNTSIEGQSKKQKSSKNSLINRIVPTSYSTTNRVADSIPGRTSAKRIIKIDLDSLVAGDFKSLREVFRGDSTVTYVEYNTNLMSTPGFMDTLGVQAFYGNMTFTIRVLPLSKFTAFKAAEVKKVQDEIDQMDKQKADRVKRREEIKKQ